MIQLLLAVIYLSFISLGLPDSLLGAAWSSIYEELGVPVSYAGMVSMIISVGTIVSSLQSERLTRRLGTGKVTVISVAITAAALFGFSVSHSFAALCLWAVPYGLGAGSVDASLNNYVAVHYASRHMSWLQCMWGFGAALGPYIMGYVLSGGRSWNKGYRCVAYIQVVLTLILLSSLPLWKKCSPDQPGGGDGGEEVGPHPLRQIIQIPGVKQVMLVLFCYCALEQTTGLWASSYMVLHCGIDVDDAASYASMFFIGITVGRAVSGFLTIRWDDVPIIRLGQCLAFIGIAALLQPFGIHLKVAGLVLIGFGCAPIYPCVIHSTPSHFGADRSQAIIGVQMASAYVGTCLMPPLFGLIADCVTVTLFPLYLLVILVIMVGMHEFLLHREAAVSPED